jgi:hypothetical protein
VSPPPLASGPEPTPVSTVVPRPTETVWAARKVAIEAQLGFGPPLGYLGAAIDYSPVPALALNAGVGLGGVGIQYALSVRLRLGSILPFAGSSNSSLYVGAGFSAGAYQTPPGLPGDDADGAAYYHWDTAYWTNLEIGGEARSSSSVTFRVFLGLGLLLNPGSAVPIGYTAPGGALAPPGFAWYQPYIGVAVGYALF